MEVDRFWFYIRKSIFQGLIPIILKMITVFDFYRNASETYYYQLYFYTAVLIAFHSCIGIALDPLFSICSEHVVYRKPIDLSRTTDPLIFSMQMNAHPQNEVIVVRRVFKPRYCKYRMLKWIAKMCWVLGMDCPILLTEEEVEEFQLPPEVENYQPSKDSILPSDPVNFYNRMMNSIFGEPPNIVASGYRRM